MIIFIQAILIQILLFASLVVLHYGALGSLKILGFF
jgi:hypothetical protein